MAALTGLVVNTKGDILRFDNSGSGVTSSLQTVKDGTGASTALGLSSTTISVGNLSFSANTISSTTGATTLNSFSNVVNIGSTTGSTINLGNADGLGTINLNGTLQFSALTVMQSVQVGGNLTVLGTASFADTVSIGDLEATGFHTGGYNYTVPTVSADDIFVTDTSTSTLTNKTLTSPVLDGTISGTGVIPVAQGGTNITSYTQGDILYASASGVLSKLTKNASSTRVLLNTGTNNNPAWGQADLTTAVTGVLPVANGGTGTLVSDPCLQRVGNLMTLNESGTTAIPFDNTKPQKTEGDQYLSQEIIPKSASSILEVEILLTVAANASHHITGALFRDDTADCVASTVISVPASDRLSTLSLKYFVVSGSTSATTFNFRAGVDVSGTCYVNSISTTSLFNGTCTSYIFIKEWVS